MTTTVTTQEELDTAISNGENEIHINSPAGVWIRVQTPRSSRVVAWGSSSVVAWGSSRVVAWGSSSVVAWESSRVEARESSSVVARESSSVVAWESSRVEAWGSSRVVARESSSVVAGSHVAVHLHSGNATVSGGVLIDHTTIDLLDPQVWCDYHGVKVVDGVATLYKAVGENWTTDRGVDYAPGSTPECDDWRDDNGCGGGLHFGPSPSAAQSYYPSATRFVGVGVAVEMLRPILGGTAKCKAPAVVRACVEVDLHGHEIIEDES